MNFDISPYETLHKSLFKVNTNNSMSQISSRADELK